MALDPVVLRNRARYEPITEGVTDNNHDDAFTHTVRVTEPDRAIELCVVALPSPEYAIRAARVRAVAGDVDPFVVAAVGKLTGARMVGGLTRVVAETVGRGAGATLVVDAAIEVARLARQVARFPRERAERAANGDPWECWQLDTA